MATSAALRALPAETPEAMHLARASIQTRLKDGFVLGMGRSSALGWFKLVGFIPDAKRATKSTFTVSCSQEERNFVFFENALRYTACRADENNGDDIHTVVEIVPCLTS